MATDHSVPVVVITGPVGVGKTTTANAMSELLEAHEIAHTLVDMDALRQTFPRPPGDQHNVRLGMRNLADLARNAREAGSRHFVLADVVTLPGDRDGYREAIPNARITVIRLLAPVERIHERIMARNAGGTGNAGWLAWEKNRAAELIGIMDANDVADLTVDTSGRTPRAVAREIAIRLGWLPEDEPDVIE